MRWRYRRGLGELSLPWGWSLRVHRGRVLGALTTPDGTIPVPVGRKWSVSLLRGSGEIHLELRVS